MSPEKRNALVEQHLSLATFFARKFRASHMELDDLIQEARIGLIDAAERFDPRRGIKFSTYAAFHIRKTILEALRSRNDVIRSPRRHNSIPCQHLPTDYDTEAEDPTPFDVAQANEWHDMVREAIKDLPARDAIVIRLRHGVNTEKLTLAKVADILGVSPERVRQIQTVAEEKLCALIQARGIL